MQDTRSNSPSTSLLFLELQKLLLQIQRRDAHFSSAGGKGSSPSFHQWLEHPSVAQELDKWWSITPACLLHSNRERIEPDRNPPAALKEGYERFYQQLARGVGRTLVSQTRSAAPFTPEDTLKAMTTDFQTDTCNSPTSLSGEERFKRSILALTTASSAIGDPAQSAESIVIRLRELYEATNVDTRAEASGSKTTSPGEVILSPPWKAKHRSWPNSERSLIRQPAINNIARKSSTLGKVDEAGKVLEPGKKARVLRSASAILPPSSPSAILDSLGKRKKSTRHLPKQHTDSSLTLSAAESLGDAGDSNPGITANPALHMEKQSSARKMHQSSKIMGGVDLSATLSKRLSTARLARTPSGISQLDSSDLSAAGNNLGNHLSSLSLHDRDNSSHFFSVETRLELKERLVALQKQLSELLVQTKLAWMKCFVNDSKPHTGSESSHRVASKEALSVANELITKGELLMTKLHNAFTKATSTSNRPIKEYQDLVESVEVDFRGFQELVGTIAHHSFPLAPALHHGSQEMFPRLHKELKSSISEPTLKPAVSHPVSFDLPSMKSYWAKVAPPYSSYLVKKK